MDAHKQLSARQADTLALIAGGGCLAVEQVYGTISASARTEYRTAVGARLDGRTVGSLLRRGLIGLVNRRETGALRIHDVAVVRARDEAPADEAPKGPVTVAVAVAEPHKGTGREDGHARQAGGWYGADGTCRVCGTPGYGCDCHARPVGGWPAAPVGTPALGPVAVADGIGRARVGVTGGFGPFGRGDRPPGWSGPVRGGDGAAVGWVLRGGAA
jgi:hypothetical protein